MRSPSSRNLNPWEFIFVEDRELLKKLSMAKPLGSSFLRDAALGIVVLGDENKSDAWIEDACIASTIIHLTTHSLNLGSCWIQIRMREHNSQQSAEAYIRELMGIPSHMRVESIIAVGHPAQKKTGHPADKLDFSKIRTNRYQNS